MSAVPKQSTMIRRRALRARAPLARLLLLLAAAAATMLPLATAAHAQSTKIFVASYGNDASDGSRGSPKRNFQAAHDAVAAGGEIVVLDTAGYGALSITKSVAVTVPPGVNGFVTVSGDASGININSGFGSVVSLRGLIIEGGGANNFGPGVQMGQGTLYLDDCLIRNFNLGVYANAGNTSNAVIAVVGRNVQMRNCYTGFGGDASGNSVGMVLTDCVAAGGTVGVLGGTNGVANTFLQITLTRCTLTGDGTAITSNGPFSTIYVDTCTVSANATGLSTSSGGQIVTRGNNTFIDNYQGDGSFTGTLSAK
ncbi:MAG: hypothetical protein JO295_04530 [Verrucomicrobia bacterium]|nr:hypothetical protein [Verrucomicrobiota bacterium]